MKIWLSIFKILRLCRGNNHCGLVVAGIFLKNQRWSRPIVLTEVVIWSLKTFINGLAKKGRSSQEPRKIGKGFIAGFTLSPHRRETWRLNTHSLLISNFCPWRIFDSLYLSTVLRGSCSCLITRQYLSLLAIVVASRFQVTITRPPATAIPVPLIHCDGAGVGDWRRRWPRLTAAMIMPEASSGRCIIRTLGKRCITHEGICE